MKTDQKLLAQNRCKIILLSKRQHKEILLMQLIETIHSRKTSTWKMIEVFKTKNLDELGNKKNTIIFKLFSFFTKLYKFLHI